MKVISGEVLCATLLFISDRIIKYLLSTAEIAVHLPIDYGLFTIVIEKNYGFAFGILNDEKGFLRMFVYLVNFVASYTVSQLFFKYWFPARGSVLFWVGTCSNVFDRWWYGAVLDYIAITSQFFSFPIFNLADVEIVIGWFLLCITIWRKW